MIYIYIRYVYVYIYMWDILYVHVWYIYIYIYIYMIFATGWLFSKMTELLSLVNYYIVYPDPITNPISTLHHRFNDIPSNQKLVVSCLPWRYCWRQTSVIFSPRFLSALVGRTGAALMSASRQFYVLQLD